MHHFCMTAYFATSGSKLRGSPPTTSTVYDMDLFCHEQKMELKTTEDINLLRSTARDRKQWRILSAKIKKRVEAALSVDR